MKKENVNEENLNAKESTTPPDAATPPESVSQEPVWCVVANVVGERYAGQDGAQAWHGTKHFVPGAKVYLSGAFWGMGGERVTVIGLSRGKRYITLSMPFDRLENWRAKLVYKPLILARLRDAFFSENWDGSEKSRERAEGLAQGFNVRAAQSVVARKAVRNALRAPDNKWMWGIVTLANEAQIAHEAAPDDPIREFAPNTRLYLLEFPDMDASRARVMGRPTPPEPYIERIVATRYLGDWTVERVRSQSVLPHLRAQIS